MAFAVSVDLFDSCTVIPMLKGGASTPLVPRASVWMNVCVCVIGCQQTLLLVIAAPAAGHSSACVCSATAVEHTAVWDVQCGVCSV